MNSVARWILAGIAAISLETATAAAPPKPPVLPLQPNPPTHESRVYLDGGFVAHALGDIDGVTGTNSYDALVQSYREGYRIFEVDMNLTTDYDLALVHDWPSYSGPLSSEQWKTLKIKGKYQSMMLDDLYDFMLDHPDMFIITDTKSADYSKEDAARQFEIIRDHAKNKNPALLDRVIPQIYNFDMYREILDIYDFDTVILTLYATGASSEAVCDFVRDKPKIIAVTMTPERYNESFGTTLRDLGKIVYFHTVNDPQEIENYRTIGIRGFYTDYARP